ncbi:hypothetical protein HDU92_000222, partial [Lobulomyces angularis]
MSTTDIFAQLNEKEKELNLLKLKLKNFEKVAFSLPTPKLEKPPSSMMEKQLFKLVCNLSDAIVKIEATSSDNVIFDHLEQFDTYIESALNNNFYHEELCLMASFNKLAQTHQIQCKLNFNVTSNWTHVTVAKYRDWLVQYFRLFQKADQHRNTLLDPATKQKLSCKQFYTYLSSIARQIRPSPQRDHDLQRCFVNGVHSNIAPIVFKSYETAIVGQPEDSCFLSPSEWNKILNEAYKLDEKFGYSVAKERKSFSKRSFVSGVAATRSYPTSTHLQRLESIPGFKHSMLSGPLKGRFDDIKWLNENNVCTFHRILRSDCDEAGLAHRSWYDFALTSPTNVSFSPETPLSLKNDHLKNSSRISKDSKIFRNKIVPNKSSLSSFVFQEKDYGSYSLNSDIFKLLKEAFQFEAKVDLFADNENKKAFHYFCKFPVHNSESNGCLGVNAFDHSWSKLKGVYANPVFKDVNLVLDKLRKDKVKSCLLIFPQLKFGNNLRRRLELLSICQPILLPDVKELWTSKTHHSKHSTPPWRVAAYLIKGTRNNSGTSFTQYRELSPTFPVTAKKPNTTLGGGDSLKHNSPPKRENDISTLPKLTPNKFLAPALHSFSLPVLPSSDSPRVDTFFSMHSCGKILSPPALIHP